MIKEALLYEKLDNNKVQCTLCAHRCVIDELKFGRCGMRSNEKGTLFTHTYGALIAQHVDPIEKKPLHHFLPGSRSFSIATAGCNFNCDFCQNWQISQQSTLKGTRAAENVPARAIVIAADRARCKSIAYTYTEPTIFFEYAYDIAIEARTKFIKNVFVTNGFMTEEALALVRPYLDAANVDLKSFSKKFYKQRCKAELQPVLETIRRMVAAKIWVEITTLIIPGENDSDAELKDIATFITSLSPDIPWHISRFHPEYEFTEREPTPIATLRRAYDIGKKCGLRYVYMGNVNEGADTCCYTCNEVLTRRVYYFSEKTAIKDGKCPKCGTVIAGVWE